MIELMATLVVGGLLMSLAVPSLSGMLKNNRISSQTNDFVTAMNLARSEAVKQKAKIDVTAVSPGNTGNEWGGGWQVAVNGGNTLRVYPTLTGTSQLDSDNSVVTFQYQPSGRINATDTLTICDDRTGETGRQIVIAATGRVTVTDLVCP